MSLTINRLDLDGTNSPLGLVSKIFAAEPNLGLRVPVEKLAERLDIVEIKPLTTEGFLGGLLTNSARTNGVILVRKGLRGGRRRFTIAHELGHFLISTHKPAVEGQFLCDKAAFASWNPKEQRAAYRMEAEANRFAAALLMPPQHARKIINRDRYASLSAVLEIYEKCGVSKEAASRCFVEYCSENVAIIIVKNGRLLREYRSKSFPQLAISRGEKIPEISHHRLSQSGANLTAIEHTRSEDWVSVEFGEEAPKMYEQIHPQSNGFATILLKMAVSQREENDELEGLTAKERYALQMERWNR